MIERALELASGYGPAEITFAQGRSTRAEYEDDRLKQVGVAQGSHLGVRVIVDGRLGRASATDPREAEAVVARAVELAEFGSEVKFDFPGSAVAPQVKTYDPEVERTPKAELVAAGAEMLALVKAYNAEIKVGAGASWSVGERRLVNSSGLDLSDRGS
ncbi:MAG TPA: DNA gyrase modulator, partial [Armatimonadota bacterium]|nr:DNA gyrase modulator [Armatimonadota bacterium]